MPEPMSWEALPEVLLIDCAQLVKANSIEGPSESLTTSPPETKIMIHQETKRII